MKTCHAKDCDVRPLYRVLWPGESPTPEYCALCTAKMQSTAMGFTVHTELIQRWDGV